MRMVHHLVGLMLMVLLAGCASAPPGEPTTSDQGPPQQGPAPPAEILLHRSFSDAVAGPCDGGEYCYLTEGNSVTSRVTMPIGASDRSWLATATWDDTRPGLAALRVLLVDPHGEPVFDKTGASPLSSTILPSALVDGSQYELVVRPVQAGPALDLDLTLSLLRQ